MKITALEIKQHEFEKSFRGYNIEEVDIFLNNLASEWERYSNESKMLRMQLEIAEKEAAKLREVEMSLIKTLQNAEVTSNKITEQAQFTADKQLEDATLGGQRILEKARVEAGKVVEDAKTESEEILGKTQNEMSEIQMALAAKEGSLKSEIAELESYKSRLISQFKGISSDALNKIDGLSSAEEGLPELEIVTKVKDTDGEISSEIETPEIATDIDEKTENEVKKEEIQGFASSANTLVLEEENVNIVPEPLISAFDDLTLIEGIGPKIYELLHANGITSFKAVATTPAYKIREVLETAKFNYTMHNPGTWPEQALLAAEGRWEELNVLKEHLMGGLEPKAKDEDVEEKPKEIPTPVLKNEQVTDEMLDRVNKVKAALRKAISDKEDSTVAETAPKVKSINDLAAEKVEEASGSFFDNL